MTDGRAIGIFDSGIGGLSVWRELDEILPGEPLLYVADQAHIPYGPRPERQVRDFAQGIVRFLLDQNCKLIVVACNTASAAALKDLRESFPQIPFIGMEPAVKPAARWTRRGTVAVMATPGTLQGRLFTETAARYAAEVTLVPCPCPGLVEAIEARFGTEVEDHLRECLQPAVEARVDTVVLACSHFPFVVEGIRRILGPQVEIIDPAPAVARQTSRILQDRNLANDPRAKPRDRFFTTGSAARFVEVVRELCALDAQVAELLWKDGRLAPVRAAA